MCCSNNKESLKAKPPGSAAPPYNWGVFVLCTYILVDYMYELYTFFILTRIYHSHLDILNSRHNAYYVRPGGLYSWTVIQLLYYIYAKLIYSLRVWTYNPSIPRVCEGRVIPAYTPLFWLRQCIYNRYIVTVCLY